MGSKLKAILVLLTVRGEVTRHKSNFNVSLTVSGEVTRQKNNFNVSLAVSGSHKT